MKASVLRLAHVPRGVVLVPVRAGVYVAVARVPALLSAGPDRSDLRAAAALPAWRAREYLAARTLLRRLLAAAVGVRVAALPLAAEAGGRPYLPERPDLSVSLSHSGDIVAVAVGLHRAVGVDVQCPELVSPEVIRRCCSPAIVRQLAALPDHRRAERFAEIWAVQEACVKADGSGLAGQPWRIPVGLTASAGRWRDLRWRKLGGRFRMPVGCAYQEVPA